MSTDGGKVSFALTLQHNSSDLTFEMMESIGMPVNEIVWTRDNAVMYVYVHMQSKTRKDALEKAMKTLSEKGVMGTNIFGYSEIDGTSRASSELIEDHPGIKTLVHHQGEGNPNFHQLPAAGHGPNSGYNKLKNKLLSKRAPGPSADGGGAGGGDGGYGGRARTDEEHFPHTRPSGLDRGESKRQRTASPSGREMVSYDVMVGTFKAVIESAVASTGSAVSSAFASERERSEQAERQVREYKLKEDRRRIEEEVAGRYRVEIEGMKAKVEGVGKTVGDLKEKHDAEMKAKDELLKTAKEVMVCFNFFPIR
jgi:hypothetical protein